MIRNVSLLTLVLFFAYTGIGHSQGVALGATYSGAVSAEGFKVPLLDGTWQAVAVQRGAGATTDGSASPPLIRLTLAQLKGARLAQWVHISASDGRNFTGGWKRNKEICDRKDVHFNYSDKNYSTKETMCWGLNHKGGTLGVNPSQVYVDFYRWSDDKGRPNTWLALSYYLVKGSRFLQVEYAFNPVTDGFADTPTADWRGNPWHVDVAPKDAKKLAYLKQLKQIGEELFSQLGSAMKTGN